MRRPERVVLGLDAHETRACTVARASLLAHTPKDAIQIRHINREVVSPSYTRPTTTMPSGQLFDDLSGAPMSTDHAIARFFVPYLYDYKGWALFCDGDVLFRRDVRELFAMADDRYAVMVVQHPPQVDEHAKKGGQIQQAYPRKNWSSVMLLHCGHPANRALTLDVLNAWPGRDLHAFAWLKDEEIGALSPAWNYLVGVNPPQTDPALVHFTLGTPDVPGHQRDPFADEWFQVAAMLGYHFPYVSEAVAPR